MDDRDREFTGPIDRVIRVDRTDIGGLEQRSFRQISFASSALDFGAGSAPGLSFEPLALPYRRRRTRWLPERLGPWLPTTSAFRRPRPSQTPQAPAGEGETAISPDSLPLQGPPQLIGIPLYDGTCEGLDEIIVRSAPAIDEATSHGVQFTRVGNPAEVCPVYERLRGAWLKAKDEIDARAYFDEIAGGVGEDHIRRREVHDLCRRFGIARDQLPCIVFFANPPSAPPAILKIRPEWIADQRAQREFINALLDFFQSVELDRLAGECGTNVELTQEFGRQLDAYMRDRLIKALAEQYAKDSEIVDGGRREKSVKTQRRFPTPPGTRWSEVSVWLTDLAITVEAKGQRREFPFAAAGFEEKRRRGVPDGIWRLLNVLARFGGVIPFDGAHLDPGTRTNLKQYMSVLRRRLRSLIPGIDGNPILHSKGGRCYRCAFTIASRESLTFPVPDGVQWPNVTIARLRSGAIRVSVPTTERFGADSHVEGPNGDVHSLEPAERESEEEHDYNLRMLGLADGNGRPNAAGKALIEVLRADGAVSRSQRDKAMLQLCGVLAKLMAGISGSPFEVARGGEKWVALFQTSFEEQ